MLLVLFALVAHPAIASGPAPVAGDPPRAAGPVREKPEKSSSAELKARFKDAVQEGYKKIYVTGSKLDVGLLIVKDDSKTVGDAAGFFGRYDDCVCFVPLESEEMSQMICTCFPSEEKPEGKSDLPARDEGAGGFWN